VVGVTFEKGDLTLTVDSSQMPVTMMIMKASGCKLLEIFFSELDATAHCKITCSARIRQLRVTGPNRFTLSVDWCTVARLKK